VVAVDAAGTCLHGLANAGAGSVRKSALDLVDVAESSLGGPARVAVPAFDQVVEGGAEHAGR